VATLACAAAGGVGAYAGAEYASARFALGLSDKAVKAISGAGALLGGAAGYFGTKKAYNII